MPCRGGPRGRSARSRRSPSAQIIPTFRKDSATDGRGALDIVRVAMARADDGRLRGEVTMEKAWTTADLRSARARRARSA